MSAICTFLHIFILIFLINIKISLSQYNKPWSDKYENNKCPKLYPKNFLNYAPVGKYCIFLYFRVVSKRHDLVIICLGNNQKCYKIFKYFIYLFTKMHISTYYYHVMPFFTKICDI